MNWLLLSLLCVFGWGFADLFYKKSADEGDACSHLKTAVWVGFVMGLTSLVLFPFSEGGVRNLGFSAALLSYAPASISYILSMIIGYAGLRYLELSIVSPVQNASGALTVLVLILYYLAVGKPDRIRETFGVAEILGTAFILAGTFSLAVVEKRIETEECHEALRSGETEKKKFETYTIGALALVFPILYCIFDTIGTAADGIILDQGSGSGLGEIDVLILYGITFFAAGIVCFLLIRLKTGTWYRMFQKSELPKALAAVCEEFGQIFYVFAMASKPMLVAPVVGSYCILSVLLSRLFLKEKLDKRQLVCVLLVISGIILLAIGEGLKEG